jgi:hypothetical protein
MSDATRAPGADSSNSLLASEPRSEDPAVCSDCGIETLDWWVDADELIHCDNAEACRSRQVTSVRLAAYRPVVPSAFAAHAAEVAPWFQADAATMDRLEGTFAAMAEFKATLDVVRPQVERLIELGSRAMVEVDAICADIPDAVWDLTAEVVDDWEVVNRLTGGEVAQEAMDLGERLARIDPPVPELRPSPERAKPPAPTAKALPVETIAYLADHGQPVAYPAGAVASRRDHESPPVATHFLHWFAEARRDIAGHGLPWAEGHLEGLVVASSIPSTYCSEWTGLAHEIHGRPDPLAASSDAWVERENDAELRAAS